MNAPHSVILQRLNYLLSFINTYFFAVTFCYSVHKIHDIIDWLPNTFSTLKKVHNYILNNILNIGNESAGTVMSNEHFFLNICTVYYIYFFLLFSFNFM